MKRLQAQAIGQIELVVVGKARAVAQRRQHFGLHERVVLDVLAEQGAHQRAVGLDSEISGDWTAPAKSPKLAVDPLRLHRNSQYGGHSRCRGGWTRLCRVDLETDHAAPLA